MIKKYLQKLKWLFDTKQNLRTIKYYSVGLYHKLDEDHMWIMSASIAFNLVICIIPLTLVLLSVLGFYLERQSVEQALNSYLGNVISITPQLKMKIREIVFTAFDEIARSSVLTAVIGSVGVLWTASGLFSSLRDVLNKIFNRIDTSFYLWAKLRDIGMVFVIVTIFLLSFFSSFLVDILKSIDKQFFHGKAFPIFDNLGIVTIILGFVFSFIMFYMIFKLVPHGKIETDTALIAAFSTSVMNESLKHLFVFYLTSFASYQKVYGAYAAIAGIIFWIYYSSFTFVLGAEIGQLHSERKHLKN